MKKVTLRTTLIIALVFILTALLPEAALAQTLVSDGIFGSSSSTSSGTQSNGIDTSGMNEGYVTVNYSDGSAAKMQVGMCFNGGEWTYSQYKMGKKTQFKLTGGSGSYTVALFKKVGSSYVTVAQMSFTAYVNNQAPSGSLTGATEEIATSSVATSKYPQYLSSVREISFSSNDSVSRKAASLCKDKSTDQTKILAIYNYIAKNFKYDYSFADKVRSGQIRTYTPTPTSILSNKKGVCYDFASLFAAMCRAQGIPCKLVKGYSTKVNGYHAWNSVYDSKTDRWYVVDLTIAVCKSNRTASKFSKCYMSNSDYTARTST